MAPQYYPLTVYRGDTHRWQFDLWADAAGTVPVDLTGVSVAATIGTTALACTVAANRIEAVLAAAQSQALAPGTALSWDLQLTYASGDVHTVMKGGVSVWADVTGAA